MLYGIKELWFKKGDEIAPVYRGAVNVLDGARRAARMYINIKMIRKTVKFNIHIEGSHPSPSPHIRLAISNKYFTYKQDYGNYSIDFNSGTSVTTVNSTSSGTHDVTIEVTNMPVPAVVSLVQNTVESHSTENYLHTYVDGQLTDTQFWSDDNLIATSMEPKNYTPTPVLRLYQVNGEIVFERLLP